MDQLAFGRKAARPGVFGTSEQVDLHTRLRPDRFLGALSAPGQQDAGAAAL